MRKPIVFVQLLFTCLVAGVSFSLTANPLISPKALMEHVRFLSSDNLNGRGNGAPGLEKAADYIADQFMADAGGIDIAIANAGIGGDDGLFSGDSNQINTILNTNILGVTNTLMPFIPAMKIQNSGALVCISSVASFMPLPFHGGYSSSKIAIRMILDSWRPTLQKYMIKTVSICPGFVDTPIVKGPARRFPMKSAEDAAEQFLKVIDLGYSTYIYPWPYRILVLIVQLTPERFYNWLIKKMFGKPIT